MPVRCCETRVGMACHALKSSGTALGLGSTWTEQASRPHFELLLTHSRTYEDSAVSGTAAEDHGTMPFRLDGEPSARPTILSESDWLDTCP